MTLKQIANEYERLVNARAIDWLEISAEMKARFPNSTKKFLAMFDQAGIRYWLGSVQLEETLVFKTDDPVIAYFEHHPRRGIHQWVRPGYHEALGSNEALAYLVSRSGGDYQKALTMGQLLDELLAGPECN